MILIKNLKLNNFLSHSETEISFKENDKILLDGKSGAGKTTITEAILFALFGRGRSENRNLIRKGQKNASITLKLSDGERETIITRSITDKGKNTLNITQNIGSKKQFLAIPRTGLKDHDNWIQNEFLRCSFELFVNSIVYVQNGNDSFIKANASRRKDLLLEIVRAENFDELYDKTRRAISANELENAGVTVKANNLENTIKVSEELSNKHDSYKKEVDDISSKIEVLTWNEKNLEKKLNDISQVSNQIKDKKSIRQMLLDSFTAIDHQLENDKKEAEEHIKLDIITARKNIEEAEKLSIETEKIEKELQNGVLIQQKINSHLANKPSVFDYSKDIKLINDRLIPLIKDSGKCPAGDKCPFVIPIKGQIDFLTEQINEKNKNSILEKKALEIWENEYAKLVPPKDTTELYSKLTELRNKIKVLLESKNVIEKYDLFESNYSNILVRKEKLTTERRSNEVKLANIETEIYDLEQTLEKSSVNEINVELSNNRILLQESQKIRDLATSNLTLATNAQLTLKDAINGLKEFKKGMLKSKEDREALDLLKEALSPRGVRAVVVDWVIPVIEEKINNILGQLSDFRIRLDTQQNKVKEEEGIREGLFITVKNAQGEEMSYENFSGGEKVKITIAIAEALSSLQNSIGFRIMDENIVSLDKESTESFVEVLTKLQDKFPQLLIISHLPEIQELFANRVIITKIGGISKVSK